jgi:putative SOS response-associated peptidase YedK
VVLFNSFSEFSKAHGGNVWFAFDEARPLAFFAGPLGPLMDLGAKGQGRRNHQRPVRVLTTEPNAKVAPVRSKAMPVVLTQPKELESWFPRSHRKRSNCSVLFPMALISLRQVPEKTWSLAERGEPS